MERNAVCVQCVPSLEGWPLVVPAVALHWKPPSWQREKHLELHQSLWFQCGCKLHRVKLQCKKLHTSLSLPGVIYCSFPVPWTWQFFLQVKVTSVRSTQWPQSKIVLHLKTKLDKNNAGYLFSTAWSEHTVVLWRASWPQCHSHWKYLSSLVNILVFWA